MSGLFERTSPSHRWIWGEENEGPPESEECDANVLDHTDPEGCIVVAGEVASQ